MGQAVRFLRTAACQFVSAGEKSFGAGSLSAKPVGRTSTISRLRCTLPSAPKRKAPSTPVKPSARLRVASLKSLVLASARRHGHGVIGDAGQPRRIVAVCGVIALAESHPAGR